MFLRPGRGRERRARMASQEVLRRGVKERSVWELGGLLRVGGSGGRTAASGGWSRLGGVVGEFAGVGLAPVGARGEPGRVWPRMVVSGPGV